MNSTLKHRAVVLAVLLAIPSALLAQENEQKAVKPEKGEKAGAPEKGKWIQLLSADTKSLDEHWTTTGNWTLMDGVATLTPREGEEGWSRWTAYLWSKERYEDFDIEFEYKLKKGGNSGFYFRVGDVNDPVEKGIEVQIYDTDPKQAADKLSDHDAGGIILHTGLKPHRNAAKPAGEWNKVEVMHFDDKIVVMLNGVNVNAHDLGGCGAQLSKRPRKGSIGFQDHALPISLRNIRIRTPSDRTGTTVSRTR
ncbi:MAG: DUF1080 domain-containing protein [Planctomycetaceae bacterium]